MSHNWNRRTVVIVAILLMSSLPAAMFAAQFLGPGSHILPDFGSITASGAGAGPTIGIDCGVGANEGIMSFTPPPAVVGDGLVDTACNWSGDADAKTEPDAFLEPLVSDNPASAAFVGPPATGGGFSAEVRLFQLPPPPTTCPDPNCINGFDIAVRFDPRYLNAQVFDQRGLPFGDAQPLGSQGVVTLATLIDNTNGVVRLAQVINGVTVPADPSGGITLYRIRFDVVGVGVSPLSFPCNAGIGEPCQVTNPGLLVTKVQNGSFSSLSFFDVVGDLGWAVSWSFSPNPMVPGSPVTFTAQASCPGAGCGSPLTFQWDFDTNGVIDATTNPTTNPTNAPVSRATLIVNDGAGHIVTAVRRPPLVVAIQGPASLAINATGTFNGRWLGGNPPYSGPWRFCPTVTVPVGTGPIQVVCTNAAPTVPLGPGQLNTQTVIYRFSGVYTDTLLVRDTASREIPQAAVTASLPLTVTGAKPAYIVTITNPAKATVSTSVPITVDVSYFGDMAVVLDLNNNGIFDAGETVLVGGTPAAGTALKDDPLIKYKDGNNSNLRDSTECIIYDVNNNNALDAATDPAIAGTCPGAVLPLEDTDTRIRYVDTNNNNILDIRLGYPFAARGTTFSYLIEWGDGLQSTVSGGFSVSASHTYTAVNTYTIRVTATETGGPPVSRIQELGTSSININTGAAALCAASAGGCDFTVSPASPTAGQVATFSVTVNGGTSPYQCAWNFGDGSTASPAPCSTGSTFTHTYATKGNFNVVLTITDSASGSFTVPHTVVVQPVALAADYTFSPASPTVGKAVTFTATVTGGTTPYSFSWNFGDGTPAGTTNPVSHTYATKGSKTVVLTVTDANAVVRTVTKTVVVAGQPIVADYTFSPASPTAGKAVTFTATVSGGTSPYTFSWNFGDGTPVQTGNPTTHTFATKGSRSVVLTVTDANAVVRTVTKTVSVAAQPLAGDFTFTPAAPTTGKAVTFTATATGGTTPYSFSWNFGDGTPAGTGSPVSHTYATKGSKTVVLTITDANLATTTVTKSVVVAGQPIVADYTFSPASPTAGKAVTFTATVSGGTTPYSFSWNFGDGTPVQTGNPTTHTFATKGSRSVVLTVTDANAVVRTVTKTVVVVAQPIVSDFTFTPAAPQPGQVVTFTATVSGGTTPYTFSWNFGDGTPAGTGNPVTHTYASKGPKTVVLTVTDANAVTSQVTKTVNVAATPLTGNYTFTPASPTTGKAVTFTATVSGGTAPYTFSWNFGDGTPAGSGSPVSHTYATKGSKTVVLTITDANAATTTVTKTVVVAGQPIVADFTFTPASPTTGKAVTFTATASGGTAPYTFSWNFGDGTPAGSGSPVSHTYATKGSKSVVLTVTDANAASTQVMKTVVVVGQPIVADYTFSPASPTAGKAVTFTATVSGGTTPYSFSWNFGDGTPVQTGNPTTHTFATKGSRSVVLTVTDANAVVRTVTKTVVVAGQPLVRDFTFTPAAPQPGQSVTFTATVSGGTSPYTFSWNFGDGTPAGTGNPVSHTYASKGPKTVVLTVTDANAVSGTVSKVVNVAASALVGDFTFTPASPTTGKAVTFTATASGGTAPYTFSWNFGDGTPAGSGSPVSHTYATKGSKTVVLTITDANAATTTVTKSVVVVGQPIVADYTFSPASPTAGKAVTFTATVSGGTSPYTFSWNFGDGTPVQTGNPTTHTFATKGSRSVVLTVTDANAVVRTVTKTVVVAAQPIVADYTFSPASPTAGKAVTFTATVSGGTSPYTFSWNFGDGTPVQTGNPTSHTFAVKGSRSVVLTVTDANAVVRTVTKTVVVAGQPLVRDFTFTPAAPQPGQSVTFTATVSGGTSPYTFSWNFGDGTPAGSGNPVSHTYASKGPKTVVLTVTDANAVSGTVSKVVNVAASPLVGDFTFTPASPTTGKAVTFTATASGGTAPYTFSWNFGDGTPAGSGSPVSHTYSTKGSKSVVLTITDANAATTQVTKSVVVVGQPIVADFTFSPAAPTAGKAVTFTATVSGGTSPYSFSWSFGDGTPKQTGNPTTHTFAVKGSRTVQLNVTDANNALRTVTKTVVVAGQPIVADYTFTPASPTAGKAVTFTATVSGGTTPYSFSWSFGDGTPVQTGNPTSHTFAVKGSRSVVLTVTDANAVVRTVTKTVVVAGQPLVRDFTFTPAAPQPGQSVTFTATVSGGTIPYTFSWNFGDGTPAGTGNPVSHTYTTKGPKTVVLTVTDANAVSGTVSKVVNVAASPLIGDFTFTPASPTTGKAVTFTATASGGTAPYTFSWNFGDGTPAGSGSPVSHTYATKGSKTVVLTITDANTATTQVTKTVVVVGQPIVADFTFTPASPTSGKPVTFTATASGGTAPYTFSWNFGDGTPAGSGNPVSHTYASAGTFTVTLTVTDANSVQRIVTKSVVVASQPCVVDFTFSPASPTAGKAVTFTATTSGCVSPTFSWNFGDGTPAGSGNPVSHTYATKGSKTVVLTVTHSGGTSTATKTVSVAPQPIVADFTFTPAAPQPGQSVTFTATVSGGTTPYTFSWNFGDGTPAGTGNPVSHTYASKGPKTVVLTVTDANAVTAQVTKTVNVAATPLTGNYTFTPASPTTGKAVTFTATVSGGTAPYTFSWNFGDGTPAGSGSPVSHTYATKGSKTVVLTITDANTATTQVTKTVVVVGQPIVADFTFTPAAPTAGKAVTFTATVSGGTSPYTFSWNFGDGTPAQTGNPTSHTFATKGSRSVVLTVTDANSVVQTVTKTVVVAAQPIVADFTFSPASPTSGKAVTFTATVSGGTTPYTFSWNFGDGTPAQTGNPTTHTFAVKGSRSVVLTVTDANAVVRTVTKTVVVAAQPIVADFTFTPAAPQPGQSVTFTATVSGGTSPYTFSWNFGDGTPAGTGNPVSHTYTTKGPKTVVLTVTDANAATRQVTKTVNVAATPLTGDFTFTPASPTTGKAVTFTATASGGTSPYTFSWNFGDGTPAGSGSPVSHTYSTKGSKTVVLTITDANAATAQVTKTVVVAGQPIVADYTFTPASPTAGKAVTFTATVSGGTTPYSFSWSFGDGTPVQTGNPTSHTFATKGSRSVVLTVTDANAVVRTVTKTVVVAGQPIVADYTFSPASPTAGKAVTFTATVSGGTSPYTFSWNFGDGTPVQTGNPTSHTFAVKGSRSVVLTVTDANAVVRTVTKTVVVAGQPIVADFTFTPAAPQPGQSVTFTATVSGGTTPYTFSWNFGDGTPAGTGNPVSHIYTTKGPKTVVLTVTDANAVTRQVTKTVNVAATPLTGNFTFSPASPTSGKAVTFTATASGGTAPYSFSWSFGDGTPAGSGSPVSHTYATKGSKTVVLTITDANLATTTVTKSVVVAGQPIVADFTFSPASPTAGKAVTFTATVNGGTTPYTFSWNFGDGTPAGSGSPVSHTYATKGTKTVVLTITDANTATTQVTKTVAVAGQPVTTDFTFTPANPLVGQSVTFTATASGGTGPYTFTWAFGDGTTGTGSPVSHSYAAKGPKTVVLTTRDANNVQVTATKTVPVSGTALVPSFTFAPASPTAGKSVTFTATASGGTAPYSFSWNFGDGTTGTGSPVSHTYSVKGTRSVVLTVTDANSATATATRSVVVAAQPLTLSISASAGATAGKPVNFAATASGGTSPYTFSWNFGDGTTGTGASPSHTYAVKGTYTARANVTDANNVRASAQTTVTVAAQPVSADFTFAPASPSTGQSVTFTATVSGGTSPYSFSWGFGDGTPKQSGNPTTHTFATKGPKTVTLNVTDANNAFRQVVKTVQVGGQPIVTDFTFTPASPQVGQSVTFTATASGGTAPYTFTWTFGDGTTGSGSPVSHTYSTKGSKTVVLTTRDANSATQTASKTVPVSGQPIAADFSFTPTSPQTGQSVTFTATASGGTTPYTFTWAFGDGSTGSGNPASHTYTTKGTFTVTLTVRDANAASQTVSHTISVSGAPLAVDFTFSPSSPAVGQSVTFTATASGGTNPYMFAWTFGDSTTGTGNPVTHSYAAAGTYTVTVTVTDANGASATRSHSVTVSTGVPGAPTACFVASAVKKGQVIGVGSPGVKFDGKCSTAAAGKQILVYTWTFGDGSSLNGTQAKPTHIYAVNGTYTVTLTVRDNTGLTGTTSQNINVKPAPIVDSIQFQRNMRASRSLTQTWVVNLTNPNNFAIHVNVEITGTADTIGAFSVSSGPVLLPAGSFTTITLSKTFTTFDIGLTYNFQVKVTFSGSGSAGPYELGAIQTDFFRIRP